MSAPSTTPTSGDTIPRIWSSENHTCHISRESVPTHPLNSSDSESEPELDCDSVFTGPSFTLSHTYSCPEIPCFPRTYYHSRSTSATSSSRAPTPLSFLDNRPQTPPSPCATSFLAAPSPLCLGPSLCHIALDNDLESGDAYLDKPCGDRDITEDDELPELVTPVSFPIDDQTYTSNQQHFLSHSLPQMRISNPLSFSTSQLRSDELAYGGTRPRAMTLPTDSVVSQPNSHTNDGVMVFRGGDLFIPSRTPRVHHTLHRKKSMLNLRDEFRRRSSTHAGT